MSSGARPERPAASCKFRFTNSRFSEMGFMKSICEVEMRDARLATNFGMQIETLKVFCDIVETGSFSDSGKRNSITQSAVSQQIRALEKKFGVAFFERGKKHFAMTTEGEVFEEAAREILEIYDSIESRLQDIKDVVEGTLRISSVFSIGLHDLPPHLETFQGKFPDVEVKVSYRRSPQVYDDILEGRADLGLVAFPTKSQGIIAEVFDEDDLVMICRPDHPLGGRKNVAMKDLNGYDFITFEPDQPTRRAVERFFREAGLKFESDTEFDNIETVKRAVEVTGGISLVPRRPVIPEVESGRLVCVEIADVELKRPVGFLRKKTRTTSPAMREFVNVLVG